MKKAIAAVVLGAAVSMPAFAADMKNEMSDAEMLFGASKQSGVEMAALSSEEMKQTEGALLDISLGINLGNTTNWYWNWVNGMPNQPPFPNYPN
ncbi:hypothetical protein [Marinobacterium stanieri]|uniref:hypothetical protein n=1 Tax=Marinobacterium stanieri TaxID=49186 RepID=UPI0002558BED|nr:hypothetical protein [Marinobacterium stanieri]